MRGAARSFRTAQSTPMYHCFTAVRKTAVFELVVDKAMVLVAVLPAEIILISAGSMFVPHRHGRVVRAGVAV